MSCLCVTEGRPAFMPWLLWNFEKQDHLNKELVVVDSSTETWRCTERNDVRVIPAPPGTSVGAKRNLAMSAAQGRVLCWFDDDDWQHPARLSRLVAALAGGAGVAGGRRSWFMDLQSGAGHRHDARAGVLFNGAAFRADLARRVPFDPRLPKASDTPWLRAVLGLAKPGVVQVEVPLHLWLTHGANLSNPASRRSYPVAPEALRAQIGAAWAGTDEALTALRQRLDANGAAQAPRSPRPSTAPAPRPGVPPLVSALARPRGPGLERLRQALSRAMPTLNLGRSYAPGAGLYLAFSAAEVDLACSASTVVIVSESALDAALRRALSRAAAVVAVSGAIADWLVRKGLKRPDLVIPAGVDLSLPRRTRLEPVFTLGVHGLEGRAAPPGFQDREGRSIAGRSLYGVDQILNVATLLSGAPLRLLLEPRYAPEGDLARRLRALGFEVEVANDTATFYPRLDALLVASQSEGGPVEALDAMAAGVPVLSRPQGELVALCDGLWDTPEQAEAHIRALLADREAGLARAAELRARVEGRTADRAAAAVSELMCRLTDASATRGAVAGKSASASSAPAPAPRPAPRVARPSVLPLPPPGRSPGRVERRVSVLMSAWRTAPWIREAAQSILDQALPPGWSLELLIGVDDCPDTLEAARGVLDRRVTVFDLGVNGGTYRALNTLLGFARGEAIAIMDSDDISEPGRLLCTLDRLYQPDAPGLVGGQYVPVNEAGQPCGPVSALAADPAEGFQHAERCFLMAHGTLVLRRAVFEALGGYDDTRVSGDADLILRALASGWRGVTLPETVLRYRQRSGPQLTRAPDTRRGSAMRSNYEQGLYQRWAGYRAGEAPVRVSAPARAPVRAVARPSQPRVQVVMPTIPSRVEGARRVIETLLAQDVARMVVLLNGHADASALPSDPRLVYRFNPPGTGPAVRLDEPADDVDVVFFVDDDLLFPPDYVAHTLRQLEAAGPGCALSYHVATWRPGATAYGERTLTYYSDGRDEPLEASYVGIGVSALPAALLPLLQGPRPPIFEINDDLWFSANLRRAGVRLVRPPSPARWIRSTDLANGPEALYRQASADQFRVRNEALAYARDAMGWRMVP